MKKRLLLTIITILFTGFAYSRPMTSDARSVPINLTELTVAQIHSAYKKGTFTSQQLVAAYIARIEQFDKKINAITIINPNALAIAKALDEEYKKTKVLRPLHGIPLIVKDNIQTVGLPTTAGALALKDFIPGEDAFVIDKLVKAGAIVLAKSNMAEWAFTPFHSGGFERGNRRCGGGKFWYNRFGDRYRKLHSRPLVALFAGGFSNHAGVNQPGRDCASSPQN
jgi:amidase